MWDTSSSPAPAAPRVTIKTETRPENECGRRKHSSDSKIDENDTYAASLVATAASVGAYALVVSLPAGGCTVRVSGTDGGTGLAIIEVYELP